MTGSVASTLGLPPPPEPPKSIPVDPYTRYQTLILPLPRNVGSSVELHPRDEYGGLAVLSDGSLVLFRFPRGGFVEEGAPLTAEQLGGAGTEAGRVRGEEDYGKVVEDVRRRESNKRGRVVYVVPPPSSSSSSSSSSAAAGAGVDGVDGGDGRGGSSSSADRGGGGRYFVTCAAFGHKGKVLYAATQCGTLLGYRIGTDVMRALRSPLATASSSSSSAGSKSSDQARGKGPPTTTTTTTSTEPAFRIKIPGGAAAWQIVVSRNGKLVLVNSADCALRLYDADACWGATGRVVGGERDGGGGGGGEGRHVAADAAAAAAPATTPRFVFQDVVSKIAWTSCDFSGDGEYVVGGCNSNPQMGDKYDLFLWNTTTGALLDRLTGPQVELHGLSFHPTRPFIAVATSDGLVDVWGPRMDWTAFAPDFQALPMNVEYVEREDEFDVVVDGGADEERKKRELENKREEDGAVDVVNVGRVPVFDSDSEDEEEVFRFETKIAGTMPRGKGPAAGSAGTPGTRDLAGKAIGSSGKDKL